jgi:hypothetical protein
MINLHCFLNLWNIEKNLFVYGGIVVKIDNPIYLKWFSIIINHTKEIMDNEIYKQISFFLDVHMC